MINVLQSFKRILILFFMLNSFIAYCEGVEENSLNTFDCDTCSSSASGGIGVLFGTYTGKNFLGLNWGYQKFQSKEGLFQNSPTIIEHYNSIQLKYSQKIGQKIGVTAILPYQFHHREYFSATSNKAISGLGDVSAYVFYNALQKTSQPSALIKKKQNTTKQNGYIGLGVKTPTGNFNVVQNNGLNPGFQVGTGSFDISVVASYEYQVNKLGLNTSLNYTSKGENKNKYQFGNQIIGSIVGTYSLKRNKTKIIPFGGFVFEGYENNRQYEESVTPPNGGNLIYTNTGAEVAFSKISLGLGANIPIVQNLRLPNFKAQLKGNLFINYQL